MIVGENAFQARIGEISGTTPGDTIANNGSRGIDSTLLELHAGACNDSIQCGKGEDFQHAVAGLIPEHLPRPVRPLPEKGWAT